MVKQADVVEVWRNTTQGRVWYFTTDARGVRKSRPLLAGRELRITAEDREELIDAAPVREHSPFLNGALRRVDAKVSDPQVPEEEQQGTTPLPEGYDPAKALDEVELKEIFAKNGQAFHSAVRKLEERHVRAMLRIAEDADSGVNATVKHLEHLNEVIQQWRKGGSSAQSLEAMTPGQ